MEGCPAITKAGTTLSSQTKEKWFIMESVSIRRKKVFLGNSQFEARFLLAPKKVDNNKITIHSFKIVILIWKGFNVRHWTNLLSSIKDITKIQFFATGTVLTSFSLFFLTFFLPLSLSLSLFLCPFHLPVLMFFDSKNKEWRKGPGPRRGGEEGEREAGRRDHKLLSCSNSGLE